jgi:hypothetical protein
METTHEASPLSSLDAFVMEWAALSISLHDYDKLHELPKGNAPEDESEGGKALREWLSKPANAQAIRPRFQDDPVSYIVALADQLQDFGRMHYARDPDPRAAQSADRSSLRLSYPCREVVLNTVVKEGGLEATIRFVFADSSKQPFGTDHKEAVNAASKKLPKGADPIFGPQGWFDHTGLFHSVALEVAYEQEVLASSQPMAPIRPSP